jgi:Plasmid pRiA4b ORF-3-like protein
MNTMQDRPKAGRSSPMPRRKKPAQKPTDKVRLYTLEVFILRGPITEKFVKENPVISRTIQIRGDQTLEDLHHAIFDAFGRWEEHMYEFQFGKRPMDPKGPRYVLPTSFEIENTEDNPPEGRVDETTIESLALKAGDRFGYWFDFGDDWWHQINVEAIGDKVPTGKLPKVTKRVGKSPPQYADEDE